MGEYARGEFLGFDNYYLLKSREFLVVDPERWEGSVAITRVNVGKRGLLYQLCSCRRPGSYAGLYLAYLVPCVLHPLAILCSRARP